MVYHKIVKKEKKKSTFEQSDVFTFTEQYKNISGFLNILKVVEREDTRVQRRAGGQQ